MLLVSTDAVAYLTVYNQVIHAHTYISACVVIFWYMPLMPRNSNTALMHVCHNLFLLNVYVL